MSRKSCKANLRATSWLMLFVCLFCLLSLSGCSVRPSPPPELQECPEVQKPEAALLATPKTNYAERLQQVWLSGKSATGK